MSTINEALIDMVLIVLSNGGKANSMTVVDLLSLVGSVFFSFVSVFFNLDLSNFDTSSRSERYRQKHNFEKERIDTLCEPIRCEMEMVVCWSNVSLSQFRDHASPRN